MIGQRALGAIVLMAGLLTSCVAAPEGLHPTRSEERADEPTGGQPSHTDARSGGCEARHLLQDKCGRCHGKRPEHGAPFSLASDEDLGATDAQGKTRRERAIAAIERGDMPARFIELEPPVAELDEEERETLLSWLRDADDATEPSCE